MYHLTTPWGVFIAVYTCDRGTGCALAVPGCSKRKRLDLQGFGTQGPMQAGPQRPEDLDHLHGRGTPPPLSAPLPMVLSAWGNWNKLIFVHICTYIFITIRHDFFFTLISSRSWATVKSGADWALRDALCSRREESSHGWQKPELVRLFTLIFFFFWMPCTLHHCVWWILILHLWIHKYCKEKAATLCNLLFLPSFWSALFEEVDYSLHAEYYSKMGQQV